MFFFVCLFVFVSFVCLFVGFWGKHIHTPFNLNGRCLTYNMYHTLNYKLLCLITDQRHLHFNLTEELSLSCPVSVLDAGVASSCVRSLVVYGSNYHYHVA